MDENMKKWPRSETGSQTGAFTLINWFTDRVRLPVEVDYGYRSKSIMNLTRSGAYFEFL